jgi:hypothetical protein
VSSRILLVPELRDTAVTSAVVSVIAKGAISGVGQAIGPHRAVENGKKRDHVTDVIGSNGAGTFRFPNALACLTKDRPDV